MKENLQKNKRIKQMKKHTDKSFPMPLNTWDEAFLLGTLPTFKKVLKNNPSHAPEKIDRWVKLLLNTRLPMKCLEINS